MSEGNNDGQYVKRITVQYATHSINGPWQNVDNNREWAGTWRYDTKNKLRFAACVRARFIRITVLEWREHISMRAGVLVAGQQVKAGEEISEGHGYLYGQLKIIPAASTLITRPSLLELTNNPLGKDVGSMGYIFSEKSTRLFTHALQNVVGRFQCSAMIGSTERSAESDEKVAVPNR